MSVHPQVRVVVRAVLPIGRRANAAEAIEGDLAAQLRGLPNEPGVRKSLEGHRPPMLEPPAPTPDPLPDPMPGDPAPPDTGPDPTPLPPDPNPPQI